MSGQDQEILYNSYCVYVDHVNAAVAGQRFRVPALKSVTYPSFLEIWNATSEQHRQWWRQRFDTGYEVVAEAQHRKFVAAFTAEAISAQSIRSARAA